MDNNQNTTQVPPQQSARGILIFGGIMLLFGLYVSAFLVPDVIRSAAGPETVTLKEAAQIANEDPSYVRLVDGNWDCDTLTYVEGYSPSHRYGSLVEEDIKVTEIFFTDEEESIVVFVTMSGEQDCEDITRRNPAGYLYEMSRRNERELTNEARLARYFDADDFLEMCGYCGRENSLIGAGFGIAFTLGGLALIIFGLRLGRRQGKQKR